MVIAKLISEAKVVFWDFDGVIKESVELKSRAYTTLFEPYGAQVANRVRDHHNLFGGVSRYEKIPLYLEWAGEIVSKTQVQEFCDRFAKIVLQSVIDSPWVPGVRDYLLGHYNQQHFILVTATPKAEIETILFQLKLNTCFQKVYGAPSKKSDAIRDELSYLNCLPCDALMIGDTESDYKAAEANSVNFLLRRTSSNQRYCRTYQGTSFDDI